MEDLQLQVNKLTKMDSNKPVNDNKNQQVHIAPDPKPEPTVSKEITSAPVAPVPAPIVSQPVSTPLPVPAVQVASQESAPISDVPWDARIHSSSKGKTVSGSWKKRRNVSQELYMSVMAELQGSGPALVVVAPVAAPPEPTAPPVVAPTKMQFETIHPTPANPTDLPAAVFEPAHTPLFNEAPMMPATLPPVPPPMPVYDPTPVPESNKQAHNFTTFKAGFAQVMASLKGEGHLTPDYILSLNSHFGVTELWELASDDKKLAELFQNFADFGWITKVD